MNSVDPLWLFGGLSAGEMRVNYLSTFAYYQFFSVVHVTMGQL